MNYQNPVYLWGPDRIQLVKGCYIVDARWAVVEAESWWHAFDSPVGGFEAGRATAVEKIRELIGEPS